MNKNMVFIEVRQDKNLALFRKEMNQRLDALSKTDNEIKSELLNHSVRIKNLEEKVIGA